VQNIKIFIDQNSRFGKVLKQLFSQFRKSLIFLLTFDILKGGEKKQFFKS